MKFSVIKKEGEARRGVFETVHGTVQTPVEDFKAIQEELTRPSTSEEEAAFLEAAEEQLAALSYAHAGNMAAVALEPDIVVGDKHPAGVRRAERRVENVVADYVAESGSVARSVRNKRVYSLICIESSYDADVEHAVLFRPVGLRGVGDLVHRLKRGDLQVPMLQNSLHLQMFHAARTYPLLW